MTDKENNFAKDINVPSKEQVIIDGVKVLKEKINMCFILLLNKLETPETIEQTIYEHLDAFVKEWSTQLARKTQECEELKAKIETYKCSQNCYKYIEATRYRKALEEIEKVINNILNSCLGRNTVGCRPAHNVCGDLIKILDIINKAKGEADD